MGLPHGPDNTDDIDAPVMHRAQAGGQTEAGGHVEDGLRYALFEEIIGVVHFRPILGNRGERVPTAAVGGLWTLKDGGRRTIRRPGIRPGRDAGSPAVRASAPVPDLSATAWASCPGTCQ